MRFVALALVCEFWVSLDSRPARPWSRWPTPGPTSPSPASAPTARRSASTGSAPASAPDFSYLWTAPGVAFDDPTILTPIGVFPVGVTEVTLTVTFTDPTTGAETSASDTALVTITDTAPPMLLVSADPAQLWPPNHKLHDVHVDVLAFDACQADPPVELLDIFSSEPDDGIGDGNTDGDIQGADVGTDDRDFALRAERVRARRRPRSTPRCTASTDLAGNHVEADALVVVPHDMGHGAANGHDGELEGGQEGDRQGEEGRRRSWPRSS